MREKEGFRDQIERMSTIYPDKITLSVVETAKVLGVDKRTVLLLIQKKNLAAIDVSKGEKNKRYIIPITAIARMAAG